MQTFDRDRLDESLWLPDVEALLCGVDPARDIKTVWIVYNGGMAKRVEVKTELTAEELHERYRKASEPVERTHWHILWLMKEGYSPLGGG